jgi:hypothetical protein
LRAAANLRLGLLAVDFVQHGGRAALDAQGTHRLQHGVDPLGLGRTGAGDGAHLLVDRVQRPQPSGGNAHHQHQQAAKPQAQPCCDGERSERLG